MFRQGELGVLNDGIELAPDGDENVGELILYVSEFMENKIERTGLDLSQMESLKSYLRDLRMEIEVMVEDGTLIEVDG